MALYNEDEAISQVKALPREAKMHLSHVVRNSLMSILSAYCLKGNVQEEIEKAEERWHSTFGL